MYHLQIALRHLRRGKLYATVIIGSLTAGFFCTTLLISFLISEWKTDQFHRAYDRTYQLFTNDPFEDQGTLAYVPDYVNEYLAGNFPEAESICGIATLNKPSIKTDQGEFTDLTLISTDSTFFSMFNFPVAQGRIEYDQLSGTIVISKAKAQQWFHDEDVVGRTLTLQVQDTTRLLKVAAVLDASPGNSHLKFDAIVNHQVLRNLFNGGSCYVTLKKGGDVSAFTQKINTDPHRPGLLGEGSMTYSAAPLVDAYYHAFNKMPHMRTQRKTFIWSVSAVCGLILLMASLNFINLLLLSLQGRRKDTGIRKTLGISFVRLLKGSLAEILIYIGTAMLLSIAIIPFALPYFNAMLESAVNARQFMNGQVMVIVTGAVLLIGLTAMIIASVQQWHMRPVNLMQQVAGRATSSKTLFTVQFVISITLAICAGTIIRQMSFIEHAPLGFNRNIVQLVAPSKELQASLPALKHELSLIPEIQHAALSQGHPVTNNWMARYDLPDGTFFSPFLFGGDEDYVRTLDLKIIAGRAGRSGSDEKLVNEKLVRYFGMKDPIGQTIPGTKFTISGVVKDFSFNSFHDEIQPAIIGTVTQYQNVIIDYHDASLAAIIPEIKTAWNKIYPDHSFFYQVLEEDLLKKHKREVFLFKTVIAFASISLFISCFGLFALSWAVVQSRTKEIGIRKVLGAEAKNILALMSMTFLKRIALAFIIAAPIGYYIMERWLESFVYRVRMDAILFIVIAGVTLFVALLTLSFQTIKATFVNPVEELRNE